MKPPRRPAKGPETTSRAAPGEMTPDDRRIWTRVSGSVTPPRSRKAERIAEPGPALAIDPDAVSIPRKPVRPAATDAAPTPSAARPVGAVGRNSPEELEPRRQRRLARERDPIDGRIDLHGFGRFEAEDQLRGFLMSAQARGWGAVLVITGQGRRGGTGVIRGSVHEWLAAPALRAVVSGFAPAHRRHGGDGAIYVTIRRI